MDVYRTNGVAGASVHKCVKLEELFVYRKTLEIAVKEGLKNEGSCGKRLRKGMCGGCPRTVVDDSRLMVAGIFY